VYSPLCPLDVASGVVTAPFPFVVGAVESEELMRDVDPNNVVVLNIDETDEIVACEDVVRKFEAVEMPLLPPRHLRRILTALLRTFPRTVPVSSPCNTVEVKTTNSLSSTESPHARKLSDRQNGHKELVDWIRAATRNGVDVTDDANAATSPVSDAFSTNRSLKIIASSDEDEGTTRLDRYTLMKMEKTLDKRRDMFCGAVSVVPRMFPSDATSTSKRVRYVRWSFVSILASLLKFYSFHVIDDEHAAAKALPSGGRRKAFREQYDTEALLAECRHSTTERTMLGKLVTTQLFKAFVRCHIRRNRRPIAFDAYCMNKINAIFCQRTTWRTYWRRISGLLWKWPRGPNGPFNIFNRVRSPRSRWRKRFFFIEREENVSTSNERTDKDRPIFAMRYYVADRAEAALAFDEQKEVSCVPDVLGRREMMKRMLSSSARGSFYFASDSGTKVRVITTHDRKLDSRNVPYKTAYPFEIVSDADPKRTILLCAQTEEQRNVWIRTIKGLMYRSELGRLLERERQLDLPN